MKSTITSFLIFTSFFVSAVTYTTDGVDSWDVNGEPPAGWLAAGTIINVGHAVTKAAYTVQLNGAVTININSGGNWNITAIQTNSTGWNINVNSGGTFETTGSLTTSSGGTITVNTGGTMTIGSTGSIVSGSNLTVDGTMSTGSSMNIGATAVVDIDGFMDIGTSWTNAAAVTGTGNLAYVTDGLGGGSFTGTLPVELIYFGIENETQLIWKTASEINNDFFEVQRSCDGVNFLPIGTVLGAGDSYEVLNYSFNIKSGKFYYRIKQVDFNGDFEYSNVIYSEGISRSSEIIQNSNSGDFALIFHEDEKSEIQVVGVDGKVHYLNTVNGLKGDRMNFKIDSKGIYVVSISTSGKTRGTTVFVK